MPLSIGATRRAVLAAGALPLFGRSASAQAYPARPITLVVPFPAGGSTDVAMRALAVAASRHLGQPIVVDNRPGATGTLGTILMARTRPDGYTVAQLPLAAVRMQWVQRNIGYDVLRELTPILGVSGYMFGALTRADAPWRGWGEMVADARRRPGEIAIGHTGVNGVPHVTIADLQLREGVEFNLVPFRGDGDGMQALAGGHVAAMVGGSSLGTLVDGGQARWLHVWSERRSARWPEAPTLVELGYPDMVVTAPYGIVGPAGLDPAQVAVLHDGFRRAIEDPGHLAVLERLQQDVQYMGTVDYAAYLRDLSRREEALVRRLGLRPS